MVFGRTLFGFLRPPLVVLTTPNAEYNARWDPMELRRPDHRFEWSRAGFRAWIAMQDSAQACRAAIVDVGAPEPGLGAATQMAVLRRTA
ncbi:hypothetical protein [Azohydromonas aeria]|uniref:hypothetical protein n=1 Tax=Azohydromonas aeria TaxID=2590212 RepID=UPI001E49442F|nr:hypothetical protein [Azohydromonas aeria]